MKKCVAPEWMSVIEAIRSHSAQTADQCALRHDDTCMSYARLDAHSAYFASEIRAAGLDDEQSVALFCERSVHVVAAMLGCLKCGVPFVPLDSAFPDERVLFMLEDASVALVLTDASTQPRAVDLMSSSSRLVCDSAIQPWYKARLTRVIVCHSEHLQPGQGLSQ